MPNNFNYEKKIWGSAEMDEFPWFLGALRLQICLKVLRRITSGSKILDAGCGGGAFCRAIKRHRPDLKIYGCDISKSALAVAQNYNDDIKYFQADICHLPKNLGKFDVVVSFDVMEHLKNPQQAIFSISQILKIGGIFHFYVPAEGNPGTVYRLLPFLKTIKTQYTGHIQNFSTQKILSLVNEAGLKPLSISNSDYFLYQAVDALFFVWLKLFNRKTYVSVEGYLSDARKTPMIFILSILKKAFSMMTYIESRLFSVFPGLGLHVTTQKL